MAKPVDGPDHPIQRYLLGRLSPAERASLEARLFEGEDLLPRIQDEEEHLIDRYLEDDLSPEDRTAFERHFAASRRRQEQVAFRRTLATALRRPSPQPAPEDAATLPAAGPPSAGDPLPRRPTAWARWIGVAALIVVGLGWLARHRLASTPVAPPAPSGGPSRAGEPSVGPLTESPREGTAAASSPSALPRPSLLLRSSAFRGRGSLPRLAAPEGTEVRLDAELDSEAAPRPGAARLCTVEGDTLWRGTASVAAGGRIATVIVPAAVLRPGDYVLFVATEDHPGEDAPSYVFRVVPPRPGGTGHRPNRRP